MDPNGILALIPAMFVVAIVALMLRPSLRRIALEIHRNDKPRAADKPIGEQLPPKRWSWLSLAIPE